MPVRIASPQNVKGLADVVRNPIYSTGVGLLHYGMRDARQGHGQHGHGRLVSAQPRREDVSRRGLKDGFPALDKIKSWFKGNF